MICNHHLSHVKPDDLLSLLAVDGLDLLEDLHEALLRGLACPEHGEGGNLAEVVGALDLPFSSNSCMLSKKSILGRKSCRSMQAGGSSTGAGASAPSSPVMSHHVIAMVMAMVTFRWGNLCRRLLCHGLGNECPLMW